MSSSLTDEDQSESKRSQFNIYKYDAQLALAFQTDCEKLLRKYSSLVNYKFETFAKVWKEFCFIQIFEGHEYLLTLQTFLENCYFVVKKFLFSTDSYVQTGALYLLYALYFKQPIKEWVKIRLTQSEADKLNEIIVKHNTKKFLEPAFIYHKLHLSGGFNYCALVLPLGLDAKFMRRYDLSCEEIFQSKACESPIAIFKELVESDSALKALTDTDNEYQKLMKEYKKKCQSLSVFPSKVNTEFQKAYNRVFNINSESNEDQDSNKKLSGVKRKAMTSKNAIYRADKETITGVEYQDFEDNVRPSCSKDFL